MARALYAESGEEPVYPGAMVREWEDEQIDIGLMNNEKEKDIIARTGVSRTKVRTRKEKYLGRKKKKCGK